MLQLIVPQGAPAHVRVGGIQISQYLCHHGSDIVRENFTVGQNEDFADQFFY
jgi:hypothetical protein